MHAANYAPCIITVDMETQVRYVGAETLPQGHDVWCVLDEVLSYSYSQVYKKGIFSETQLFAETNYENIGISSTVVIVCCGQMQADVQQKTRC